MCYNTEETAYGCLFCKTGRENSIAVEIEKHFPDVSAIAPMKTRRRRSRGELTEERVTLFPGYVFFCTHPSFNAYLLTIHDGVYSLLESSEKDWRLSSTDAVIAQRLFEAGGEIGLSEAYFEGEHIRIIDGFLKEYEGNIIRVNRRAKTVQISIQLQEKTILLWLGYEEVRPA